MLAPRVLEAHLTQVSLRQGVLHPLLPPYSHLPQASLCGALQPDRPTNWLQSEIGVVLRYMPVAQGEMGMLPPDSIDDLLDHRPHLCDPQILHPRVLKKTVT